jgi:alkylhydroperoxidase family enzyme
MALLEFHTAAVQQLGYTDAQIAESFMVVGLFHHTNILMHGLKLG